MTDYARIEKLARAMANGWSGLDADTRVMRGEWQAPWERGPKNCIVIRDNKTIPLWMIFCDDAEAALNEIESWK